MAYKWCETRPASIVHVYLRFAISCALLLVALLPAYGQQFASLSLQIDDPAGAALARSIVSIRNVATGVERKTASDAIGVATIPGLAAGRYRLTVEAAGFNGFEAPLTLTLGREARLHVAMRVQSATESVVVADTSHGIDTERTEASQVIAPDQISTLPIPERDFIDFVLLTPTATIGRSTSTAAQSAFQETELMISLGGLRETHSVFYGIDGVEYNTSASGVQRVSPSLDWVEEFRATNAPGAADAGMNLGSSVNTITKSGTNDLHGSAYDHLRDNQFDAHNLLSAPVEKECHDGSGESTTSHARQL